MWNNNDKRYSDFGHFYEENVYISRAVSTGQCGLLTMIDTPIFAMFLCEENL